MNQSNKSMFQFLINLFNYLEKNKDKKNKLSNEIFY